MATRKPVFTLTPTLQAMDLVEFANSFPDTQPFTKEPLVAYTDGRNFFVPRADGVKGWMSLNVAAMRRRLKKEGLKAKPRDGENLSQVDLALVEIENQGWVDYSGPLAGHKCGVVREGSGRTVLVTSEPRLTQPAVGSWETLKTFFEGLLNDTEAGIDQTHYFYAWVKCSIENLFSFTEGRAIYQPAAATAFCGPRDCGKTLLLELLQVVFGRSESAYLWLSGATDFNSELAGAELLTVDDDAGMTDYKHRRGMTNKIKNSLFSGQVKIHKKGAEAISLRPWWRLVFALNDEPEDLRVLPLIDDSMADKISLFRCLCGGVPMPQADRMARWQRLKSEIPAFLHWLINEHKIAPAYQDSRTGSKAFQHPQLIEALTALDPSASLLALIDEAMRARLPAKFTAREVEQILTERNSGTEREARKLLPYANSCGTYLARLATNSPKRVSVAGSSGGVNSYFITHPDAT